MMRVVQILTIGMMCLALGGCLIIPRGENQGKPSRFYNQMKTPQTEQPPMDGDQKPLEPSVQGGEEPRFQVDTPQ
ncbi:MAG: hypothetical protein WC159_02460 [Sphaerochaetaceae bacterium]